MINWNSADDFFNSKHIATGKPVLLYIHSEKLECCNALERMLGDVAKHHSDIDDFFPVKVSSHRPSPNEKRIINNHIFVASPILQILNRDGSRSHEFSYVPRQTRHAKGYEYTHNENAGTFDHLRLRSQLKIGLAKFFLFNKSPEVARKLAREIIDEGVNDPNATAQAHRIVGGQVSQNTSSFLETGFSEDSVASAVAQLLTRLRKISDDQVMKEWKFSDGAGDWAWYTDCVRELSFQIYQTLVSTAQSIERTCAPLRKNPETHQVISNWHSAYRKMQSDFIGVPDALLDTIALRHERSLRENIVHCMLCESGAHGLQILNTLNMRRNPTAVIDFETHQARTGEITTDLAPASTLFTRFEQIHSGLITQLSHVEDEALLTKSAWWEPTPVSLGFRLDRLGWHLQDHRCTHRKLLAELSFTPTLTDTFSHTLFEGLAAVECAALGAEAYVNDELSALKDMLSKRTSELASFM